MRLLVVILFLKLRHTLASEYCYAGSNLMNDFVAAIDIEPQLFREFR